MRVIESKMNQAILNQKDWKNGNTRVVNQDDVSYVYLFGNKIAEVGDTFIRLYDGGWQSVTTKSRLNAILKVHGIPGERVFQRDFQWYVQLGEGGPIPFFSGMRLN